LSLSLFDQKTSTDKAGVQFPDSEFLLVFGSHTHTFDLVLKMVWCETDGIFIDFFWEPRGLGGLSETRDNAGACGLDSSPQTQMVVRCCFLIDFFLL